MKKYFIISFVFMLFFLAACNKTEENQISETISSNQSGSKSETEKSKEKTSKKGSGLLQSYTIKKAAKTYIKAANKVKSENIGFSKSSWQDISDIQTKDSSGLANKILNIVFKNVVTSKEDAFNNSSIIVPSGNKEKIMVNFPVFNQAYAADLKNDFSCISSADYKKQNGKYYISLYFKEVENAEQDDGGFGSIMPPFMRNEILDFIKNYVLFADLDRLALDFNYYDSYLYCEIDASSMQLEKLEISVKAHLDASAEFNVFNIVKTNVLNGTANIENNIHYYDFDWQNA